MNPNDLTEEEEKMFSRKLKHYLRCTGRLFPITADQVKAFEEYTKNDIVPPLPPILRSAEAMLARGYINSIPTRGPEQETNDNEGMKMAARNGGELSADVLRKLHDDQENGKKPEDAE